MTELLSRLLGIQSPANEVVRDRHVMANLAKRMETVEQQAKELVAEVERRQKAGELFIRGSDVPRPISSDY